jgi:3-methylfumaryl-CoA hydratase
LPPLAHWLYFLPQALQREIGADGHPKRGGFLPPVPLPRRMWAGSRFAFDGEPLRVGEAIRRASKIKSVEPKSGSTGSMVFVTVEHTVSGARGPSFVEEHDIVYREAAKPGEKQREPRPAPADATWSKKIMADPVLLFRFSALTFNAHRIHYDHPYATKIEGYEGLVVHGPLMAVLMLDLVDRVSPGAPVSAFDFKAVNPAFVPHALAVRAKTTETGFALRVESSGRIASTGTATAPRPLND